jgi:ferrochelatase
MAYGTPRSPDDVEAYYTHIRRGRPPTPEQLTNLQARYDALGGVSPLAQRTEAQRAALAAALDATDPGRFQVVLGQKHAAPFIEDAIDGLADAGCTRTVGLVLAPHYAGASVGEYQARATESAEARGVSHVGIRSWHLESAEVEFLAAAVADARAALPARTRILFTAHSLPERALVGDPYPHQLAESADAVATRLGLADAEWGLGWQSAGATPDPWRGPDVLELLRTFGADEAVDGVLVCAQGFTADHLEVLYDLDIEAQRVADEVGLAFARTRCVNDDPSVMAALAARVIRAADGDPTALGAPE